MGTIGETTTAMLCKSVCATGIMFQYCIYSTTDRPSSVSGNAFSDASCLYVRSVCFVTIFTICWILFVLALSFYFVAMAMFTAFSYPSLSFLFFFFLNHRFFLFSLAAARNTFILIPLRFLFNLELRCGIVASLYPFFYLTFCSQCINLQFMPIQLQ